MSDHKSDFISYAYGATVVAGGLIGYFKAKSIPSLVAGFTFGGLASLGGYQLSHDPNNYYLALATSGILAGLMGKKFLKSGKFMPPGLIASLSVLQFGRLAFNAYNKK